MEKPCKNCRIGKIVIIKQMLPSVYKCCKHAIDIHGRRCVNEHLAVHIEVVLLRITVEFVECARLPEHCSMPVEDCHRCVKGAIVIGLLREDRAAHVILSVGIV